MNVLVACEESQEVCKAFRARGHRAFSCDIQECSGGHPEWHIKQDVIPILDGYCSFYTTDGKLHYLSDTWDLIIAHPPCTYMSKAGACRMYRRINGEQYINVERYKKMQEAKDFFYRITLANCSKIAVENPRPLKICGLPQPSQVIQPYQFGHPYSKETLLWLIHLPKLKPTNILNNHIPFLPSNTSGYSNGKGGSRGVAHDPKTAAHTFPGIARAMAEQWG